MKKIALTIGMTSLLAAPLFAQAAIEDTDGSGAYSFTEVAAAYPDVTEETFLAIDTDASGEVSDMELSVALGEEVTTE